MVIVGKLRGILTAKKGDRRLGNRLFETNWSGREDSNLRPPHPQPKFGGTGAPPNASEKLDDSSSLCHRVTIMVVAFGRNLFRPVAASCTTSAPPERGDSKYEAFNASRFDTSDSRENGIPG